MKTGWGVLRLNTALAVATAALMATAQTTSGIHHRNGKIDEIMFYNRTLSAVEVRHLYEMRESEPCRM